MMKRHGVIDLPFSALQDREFCAALIHGYDLLKASPGKNSPRWILSQIDVFVRSSQKSRKSLIGRLLHRQRKVDAQCIALGVVAGWQLVHAFGWRWTTLVSDAAEQRAVVSADGAMAVYPLEHIYRCLMTGDHACDLSRLFASLERKKYGHLVPGEYYDLLGSRA